MHNGFLQVEGEKMSKSLGNFVTINELLATRNFGSQPWHGRVIRLAMLGTHYRQPIDWTVDRLVQARSTLMDFGSFLHEVPVAAEPHPEVIAALSDDLNTPSAMSIIHGVAKSAHRNAQAAAQLKATLQFLGVYGDEKQVDFAVGYEAASVDEAQCRGTHRRPQRARARPRTSRKPTASAASCRPWASSSRTPRTLPPARSKPRGR